MVATDNHLGYMEKDPIRGNDSFVSFEEILQCAAKEQVCCASCTCLLLTLELGRLGIVRWRFIS